MKNFAFYFAMLVVSGIVFSCKKENMGDCFKSTGDISVEYRTLAAFDTIEVDDNVNVFITNDTFFEVKVEAGENLIPLVKTKVENNTLKINNDNTCNWVRSFEIPINVYVTMPTPGALYSLGVGNIKSLNALTDRTLIIKMTNSGDVDLELGLPHLLCNISAANGNMYLRGNVPVFEVFCIGTTIVSASDLLTEKTYIQTWGTGDMHVNASVEVGANINWVGNVYYKGSAVEAYANYTSSGRLIKE